MPPPLFGGSADDLARLVAGLAAAGQLSELSGGGGLQTSGLRAGLGFGALGGPRLMLIPVPGIGLIGATIGPDALRAQVPFPFSAEQPDGTEEDDLVPGTFAYAMQAAMEQVMRTVMERSMQDQQPTVPPANESMRDALPRVIVTKEDQLDATNSKCAVCLDDYKIGTRATRMLCGHLFCTNCIREWLRTANSCPVCRFELVTDNEEYEVGRVQRMKGRITRLKDCELGMMRVPELKRLMRALGVSGEGCVEKADLIEILGAAPGIELTSDRKDIFYEESELQNLEMPLLRSLMERHLMKVPTDSIDEEQERVMVLEIFGAAGWMTMSRSPNQKLQLSEKSGHHPEETKEEPAVGIAGRRISAKGTQNAKGHGSSATPSRRTSSASSSSTQASASNIPSIRQSGSGGSSSDALDVAAFRLSDSVSTSAGIESLALSSTSSPVEASPLGLDSSAVFERTPTGNRSSERPTEPQISSPANPRRPSQRPPSTARPLLTRLRRITDSRTGSSSTQ